MRCRVLMFIYKALLSASEWAYKKAVPAGAQQEYNRLYFYHMQQQCSAYGTSVGAYDQTKKELKAIEDVCAGIKYTGYR